ncbi:MAG: hypothetical protein ABJE95_33120 [Byssovorax sp.]
MNEAMIGFDDSTSDRYEAREPGDPQTLAGVPSGGYEPHPLFPREDDGPELRDIQFVTFRRRRSDGRIDNCPEDIPACEVLTWADVVRPWGGGEYKAIGKDKNHRIVAWYPTKIGEWACFDGPSKPFTLRGHPFQTSPPIAEPVAGYAPTPVAESHPTPPLSVQSRLEATVAMLARELHEMRMGHASAHSAASTATPPHPLETSIAEVLREFRAARAPAPHPLEAGITEMLREIRSARRSASEGDNAALREMIKEQRALICTLLSAISTPRPVEPPPRSIADSTVLALQLLGAFRQYSSCTQPSVKDGVPECRAIRELTAPGAPPTRQPMSEFSEIKDLLMALVKADAPSTSARHVTMPPPMQERRPPPPSPPIAENRPLPPSRPLPSPPPFGAPFQHVAGLGMVQVPPEPLPIRSTMRDGDIVALVRDGDIAAIRRDGKIATLLRDNDIAALRRDGEIAALLRDGDIAAILRDGEIAALLRDPAIPHCLVAADGLDRAVDPAPTRVASPPPEAPAHALSSALVGVEPAPAVSSAASVPTLGTRANEVSGPLGRRNRRRAS